MRIPLRASSDHNRPLGIVEEEQFYFNQQLQLVHTQLSSGCVCLFLILFSSTSYMFSFYHDTL